MRLAFPNGEHDEFAISRGTFSIGSSTDADVTLTSDDIQPRHADITVDHRGITLLCDIDDALLKVNNRPVLRKAILRLGDTITMGNIQFELHGEPERIVESVPAAGEPEAGNRNEPSKYLVRGLTGAFLGQGLNLYDRIRIGGSDADIALDDSEQAATIQVENGLVYLRDGSGVVVNGHPVSEALLDAGDQLLVGTERFLLEAPAFVPGKAYAGVDKSSGAGNTQVFTAPVLEEEKGATDGKETDSAGDDSNRRDAIIVGVCLALSAAMVVWLISVYFSS